MYVDAERTPNAFRDYSVKIFKNSNNTALTGVTVNGGTAKARLNNPMIYEISIPSKVDANDSVVFMPKYVAMSSAAVVFLWILDTDYGILNYFLSEIGLHRVNWLGERGTTQIGRASCRERV